MPKKFEETDEIVYEEPEHWELLEARSIYISGHAYVTIPKPIVEHLELENKDKIDIAIKRHKPEP